ncbi:ATP-binding protein [uncultured Paludibaculum sp.]|uniref:ATP-binding protein n=1 Tax=uncultured Paludibaculum sp. TaxID=1765020 RepID=UPI002AAC2249|nr:ATP-binding protein [uncultured Paludibaculum sp.]
MYSTIFGSLAVRAPLACVLLQLLFPSFCHPAERPPLKHLLFLNSYHEGYHWSDELLRGVRSALEGQPFQVEVWTENMDMKRQSGPRPLMNLRTYLERKYRGRKLDAVVACDDDAIRFALDNDRNLFGGAPVIFCGLNDWTVADEARRLGFTGVLEDFAIGAILDLATRLNPNARHVWVVNDNSPAGWQQKRSFQQIAKQRPRMRFDFLDGSELSLDEIVTAMGRVNAGDLVILTAFAHDRTGDYLDREESQRRIAQASAGQIYSPSISSLGQGILAGNDNAGFQHGALTGRKAVQVLRGDPIDSIPIEKHTRERYVFDYDQLAKHRIDMGLLPAGSRVIHRPSSFYTENRTAIWIAFAALMVESAIILFLLVNIRRRRAAENALARKAEELSAANRDLLAEMDERRKAEGRVRTIQEQFWQSQKMEAVGRLAGGIAHDFNNLLTVIGGYGRMILEGIQPESNQGRVEQMVKASDRAAELTSQLLAFGRKNVIQPKAISLNDVVTDNSGMLQRIIGEDIKFSTELQDGLAAVMADSGQISQVLLNLAANARDAMAANGEFRIETSVVFLGRDYALEHADVEPGRYVQLAVSDTGCGMDEETRQRSFEPFFTTKPVGKGTGLGLSTVYGIIKQAGGHLWVYSEPGKGTTLKIHLPALTSEADLELRVEPETRDLNGSETILVVEDQGEVRSFVVNALESHGYSVLSAKSGEDALSLLARKGVRPDLLLTDVVMPGIDGRALAEKAAERQPGLKVLYTSGYTEAAIVSRGVLEPDLVYLPKPFAHGELLHRVRQALD